MSVSVTRRHSRYAAKNLTGQGRSAVALRNNRSRQLPEAGPRRKLVDDLNRRDLGATIAVRSFQGRLLVIHDSYRGNCLWRSLLIDVKPGRVEEVSFRGSDLAETCAITYSADDPKPFAAYQEFRTGAREPAEVELTSVWS